jgi:hypothetical protein
MVRMVLCNALGRILTVQKSISFALQILVFLTILNPKYSRKNNGIFRYAVRKSEALKFPGKKTAKPVVSIKKTSHLRMS